MLSKKIVDALNAQVAQEAGASNAYLAMASWCETKGLQGCTSFFYTQSEEEREHMMKIFRYINETGGQAAAPEVKKPVAKYKDIGDVFETSLKMEQENTKSILKIVDACTTAKDYTTLNFLQWFVAEQHEEEALFGSIIDFVKLTGTDGRGAYFIDKEVNNFRQAEQAEEK